MMAEKKQQFLTDLQDYACYLRTKKTPDEVKKARQDAIDNWERLSVDERKKRLSICYYDLIKQEIGIASWQAYDRWKDNKTSYTRNLAFTICTREGQSVPADLMAAVLEAMDKQNDKYEADHLDVGNIFPSESKQRNIILEYELQMRTGTKVEVFKKYADEWGVDWELLRESHKKYAQRNQLCPVFIETYRAYGNKEP